MSTKGAQTCIHRATLSLSYSRRTINTWQCGVTLSQVHLNRSYMGWRKRKSLILAQTNHHIKRHSSFLNKWKHVWICFTSCVCDTCMHTCVMHFEYILYMYTHLYVHGRLYMLTSNFERFLWRRTMASFKWYWSKRAPKWYNIINVKTLPLASVIHNVNIHVC